MANRVYSRLVVPTTVVLLLFFANTARAFFFAERFPVQGVVAEQMRFWLKIFEHYDSTTTLIHDTRQLSLVVDVIDFRDKYQQNLGWQQRQKIAQRYVARYRQALRRFKKYRLMARKYGSIEQRVYRVYRRDLSRLLNGKARLRSQSGLRDSYRQAIKRATPFMPHMEGIFRQHRLPTELVRLTFVESMFNHQARSKVGAAGVWQFMPTTAREFLHLNSLVDERISPLKATRAAARLLRRNYRKLNSWPLAVTAYNQGLGAISRAVKKLRTKDLATIVENHRSRSFGFAGRNFYSEFIAAARVYKSLRRQHDAQNSSSPLAIVSLRLPKQLSTARLVGNTSLDQTTLGKYNPCLSTKAFTSKRYVKLPPYYEIFVPKRLATKIKKEVHRI